MEPDPNSISSPNPSSTLNSSNGTPLSTVVMLNHQISTKLDRENYLSRQSQIVPILHGYNLYQFLESSPPSKTITTATGVILNKTYLIWHRQDQILLGWLRSSLTCQILAQVVSAKTTADLWQTLQQSFSAISKARLSELRRQLHNTSKGTSTCSNYIQRVQAIADELAFIGSPVPDDDLMMHVLRGLGPEFDSFVIAATTTSRSLPDLQVLLLSHEALINSRISSTTQTLPSAFSPSAYYSNSGQPPKNNNSGRGYRPRFPNSNNSNRLPLLPSPGSIRPPCFFPTQDIWP